MGLFDFFNSDERKKDKVALEIDLQTGVLEECPVCRNVFDHQHDERLAAADAEAHLAFDRNDPRVRAAWNWIRQNYTLTSNPNMPRAQSKEGLYYYYHVFAKALDAWGERFVVDPAGAKHDWRAELADQLLSLQRPDGAWVNSADRWQEGNPNLVTAYAVLALQIATR